MSDNGGRGLIDVTVRDAILTELPDTVQAIVTAVTTSGQSYGPLFASDRAPGLRTQIDVALRTFLRLAHGHSDSKTASDDVLMRPALDAAFGMGRDQAAAGRDTLILLTAFRVGARTAWHRFAATATDHGMSAGDIADLAELLFDFIDQLSAGTVAGHEHHVSRSLQVREQERALLVRDLVAGVTPSEERQRRAEWRVPVSAAVVLVREADLGRLREHLPAGSLIAVGELQDSPASSRDSALALLGDLSTIERRRLLDRVHGLECVVGPTVALSELPMSHRWATILWNRHGSAETVDVEQHLVKVVLGAEPGAVNLLRAQLLAGLDGLGDDTRTRLETTLACWLAHRGRFDRVAAELHLHPQTVRYRIGQVQDRLGDVLADPKQALALHVALSGARDGLTTGA